MSYSQKDNSLTAQFCYSSTVDELVNKLRNNYAWDDAEVLPKWISAPLAKYPQLQAYTRKFMYFLRSTTTSFGNTKLNYYDVLINCMITDQFMGALKQFEARYRAAHSAFDSESSANTSRTSYLRWLFSVSRRWDDAASSKGAVAPKPSNLERSPLYRYFTDTDFIPCETDREFMQVLALLYPYAICSDDGLPMLPHACFAPLMHKHPYFMYTIEQKWHLYFDSHLTRSTIMQHILDSLFRTYRDPKSFMEFQQEWFSFTHHAFNRTKADMFELDSACSELFDIVKPRKPREADVKVIDDILPDDQQLYWSDFLAGKRYNVLFAAMRFFFGSDSKQEPTFPLQLLRASIGSEDIERHLNFTLTRSSKHDLAQYAKGFGELLEELKTSCQWDLLFEYLERLFSKTDCLLSKTNIRDPANRNTVVIHNLVEQQKRTERTVARSTYPDDCRLLSAIYASLINAAHVLLPDSSHTLCKVSNGSDHPIDFYAPYEYHESYAINSLCSSDTHHFLVPTDYVATPCTRMMFSLIYSLGGDAINNGSSDRTDYENCLGAYILAFLSDREVHREYFLDDEQTCDMRLWRWAHRLLHTSEVKQREFKDPVVFPLDSSGNEFSLLKNTMEWFWQMDELCILVYDSDPDFESHLQHSIRNHDHISFNIPEGIINEGIRYWEQLQQGNIADYKLFLKENLHISLRNTVK